MPVETGSKVKSKRPLIRHQTSNDADRLLLEVMGSNGGPQVPHDVRERLLKCFSNIEKEFCNLYRENISLQDKLELALSSSTDRPTTCVGSSITDPGQTGVGGLGVLVDKQTQIHETTDGSDTASKPFKTKAPSQISQRIKTNYKATTSRIVSSFKGPSSSSSCQYYTSYRGHKDGIWEVSFSRYGPSVIGTASADKTARLWSVDPASCLVVYLGNVGSVNSIRFHPSDTCIVMASGDKTAHLWRYNINLPSTQTCVGGGQSTPLFDLGGTGSASAVTSKSRQSSGEEEPADSDKEDDFTMDTEDGSAPTMIHSPSLVLSGHMGVVIAADWLRAGRQVVTASWDRTANLWDAERGDIVQTLTGHDQELTNVSTHSNQAMVVTSSVDTTFRLWDFRDKSIHSVNVFQGHTQTVTTATFTSEDKIVSGSDDHFVKIWDLRNMRSALADIRTNAPVNRLAVSPTHSIICVPQDNRHVRLFDLNGVRLARLPRSNRQGHRRMVTSVSWATDDTVACNLFTAGFDKQVLGWTINFQTLIHG